MRSSSDYPLAFDASPSSHGANLLPPLTIVESDCYKFMVVIVATMIVVMVATSSVDRWFAIHLTNEGGVVENGTVLGYGVCLLYMMIRGRGAYVRKHWYLVLLVLCLALRELDVHKAFTVIGILRTRFFLSPEVPALQKLIGGGVVVGLVAIVLIALRRHAITLCANLRRADPVAVAIFVAIALGVVSKTLDGSKRKLEVFALEITRNVQDTVTYLEETLELGIPAFLLVAVYGYLKRVPPSVEQTSARATSGVAKVLSAAPKSTP